jgi:hypothetical protein
LTNHNLHFFHEDALSISGSLGVHSIPLAADLIEFGCRAGGAIFAEEFVVDSGAVFFFLVVAAAATAVGREDECGQLGYFGGIGNIFRFAFQEGIYTGICGDGRVFGGMVVLCLEEAYEDGRRVLFVDGLFEPDLFKFEFVGSILEALHVLLFALALMMDIDNGERSDEETGQIMYIT